MLEAADGQAQDAIEGLLGAIVRMIAPSDVAQQADRMAQPVLRRPFTGKERPGPFLQRIAHGAEAPLRIRLVPGGGKQRILAAQRRRKLAEDIALAQAEGG